MERAAAAQQDRLESELSSFKTNLIKAGQAGRRAGSRASLTDYAEPGGAAWLPSAQAATTAPATADLALPLQESIRMGHNDLGSFYYRRGDLTVRQPVPQEPPAQQRCTARALAVASRPVPNASHLPLSISRCLPSMHFRAPSPANPSNTQNAFKNYMRARDYCTSPHHVLAMCLAVIRTSIGARCPTRR